MGVEDESQVREGVFDFLTLVKADATDDLVVGAGPAERVLERARLRVGPIEDGDRVVRVIVQRIPRRARDEFRFVQIVAGAVVQHGSAALPIRVEALLLRVTILRNDGRRRVEDHLGRPVIALEADDSRLGKVVLEIEDVPQVCSSPLVD